jgi:hypothetical protein
MEKAAMKCEISADLALLLAIYDKQGELNVTDLTETLDILLPKCLSQEEEEILEKHIGWEDHPPMTNDEIARDFEIEPEEVEECLILAFNKLRHPSSSKYLNRFIAPFMPKDFLKNTPDPQPNLIEEQKIFLNWEKCDPDADQNKN